jgi:hypothetical protein
MADYEGFREWLYVESEISIDKQNVNHILVEANCSCFIWWLKRPLQPGVRTSAACLGCGRLITGVPLRASLQTGKAQWNNIIEKLIEWHDSWMRHLRCWSWLNILRGMGAWRQ